MSEWKKNNKDYWLKWKEANPNYYKLYREKNKEKIAEYNKKYRTEKELAENKNEDIKNIYNKTTNKFDIPIKNNIV